MRQIRDYTITLAKIDDGELVADINTEIQNLVVALIDNCDGRKKAKAKGTFSLHLKFEIEDGVLSIDPDIIVKAPKRRRATGTFWANADGTLSDEHPSQTKMDFSERARSGTAVVTS